MSMRERSHARRPNHGRSRVTVVTQPMWRLRFTRAAPRRVLQTLVVAGVLAVAHYAAGGGSRSADTGRQPATHINTPTAKEPRK